MMVEGINLLLFGADQVVIQTPYRGVFNVGGIAVAELRLLVILTACALIGVDCAADQPHQDRQVDPRRGAEPPCGGADGRQRQHGLG